MKTTFKCPECGRQIILQKSGCEHFPVLDQKIAWFHDENERNAQLKKVKDAQGD